MTLFSIKINNITKCLTPRVDGSLYVDNLLICYRSKYIYAIECKLQKCLDKLNKWATENGFRFSQTKTKCVHFCHERKLHNDPCLKLKKKEIPLVNEHKFLGLVFNKKLTFIPHLKYLRSSCNKRLQLLSVIAHCECNGHNVPGNSRCAQTCLACSSYIDDIFVNESVCSAAQVKTHLELFGLTCKDPEQLSSGARVLGVYVWEEHGKLRWRRDGEHPKIPDASYRLFCVWAADRASHCNHDCETESK